MRWTACLAALLLAAGIPRPVVAADRLFSSGYAGTLPTDARDLAKTYFRSPAVRRLLFQMEKAPVGRDRVDAALAGTGFGASDLLRVGVLRQQGHQFFIGFNYFNAEDAKAIERACRRHAPALARAFLDHREDFDAIFATYPVSAVSRSKLAFVLIAGFALNWEGLRVSRALGYRSPILVRGDGWAYSFWSSEEVPGRSLKELYSASSTFPSRRRNFTDRPVDFAFSSYGNALSEPRMSFPDLFFTPRANMAPALRESAGQIGTIHETGLGLDLDDVLGAERARDFAALLFALRAAPRTSAALAETIREPAKISAYLTLLERAQYVERGADARYELLVPVLDTPDREVVERTIALARQIIVRWLETSYGAMRADLGTLTSMRHGVPFESLFTQIWHEVFGQVTRELAHAGFIFDTYGERVAYKGSLPALWKLALYEFEPG